MQSKWVVLKIYQFVKNVTSAHNNFSLFTEFSPIYEMTYNLLKIGNLNLKYKQGIV